MPTVRKSKYIKACKVYTAEKAIRFIHKQIDHRAEKRPIGVRCTDITENKVGTVYHFG